MELKITLDQLERLLDQQKAIVIEKLAGQTSYYNNANTPGSSMPIDINKERFSEVGRNSKYPDDYEVLKRYLK